MARKLTGATDAERDAILHHFDEPVSMKPQPVIGCVVRTTLADDYGMLFIYSFTWGPLLNCAKKDTGTSYYKQKA